MPDGQGNVRVGNTRHALNLSPQDRDRLRNWGGEGTEENRSAAQ